MEFREPNRFDKELTGEVVCDDFANSRAIYRFVQKWIGRWIAARLPYAQRPGSRFHVKFSREGHGHTVACEVRVSVGPEAWSGFHYGENISEALRQSLAHMIRVSSPLPAKASLSTATRF